MVTMIASPVAQNASSNDTCVMILPERVLAAQAARSTHSTSKIMTHDAFSPVPLNRARTHVRAYGSTTGEDASCVMRHRQASK